MPIGASHTVPFGTVPVFTPIPGHPAAAGLEMLKRRQPTDLGVHRLQASKWSALGAYRSRTRRDISTSPGHNHSAYERDLNRGFLEYPFSLEYPGSAGHSGRISHAQICTKRKGNGRGKPQLTLPAAAGIYGAEQRANTEKGEPQFSSWGT